MLFGNKTLSVVLITSLLALAASFLLLDIMGSSDSKPLAPAPKFSNENTKFSLIVSGATGATARHTVAAAVNDANFNRVVALSRRSIPIDENLGAVFPGIDVSKAKQKLLVKAVDWEKMYHLHKKTTDAAADDASSAKSEFEKFNEDGAFSGHTHALGAMATTRKDAGGGEGFVHVDYDFALTFWSAVKLFSKDTLQHAAQISAKGASSSSWFLYMETKGKTDDWLKAQKLAPMTSIYLPGLLGRDEKARGVESVASYCVSALPTRSLGRAVVQNFLTRAAAAAAAEGKKSDGGGEGNAAQSENFFNEDVIHMVAEYDSWQKGAAAAAAAATAENK